jgi:hypothetical protein
MAYVNVKKYIIITIITAFAKSSKWYKGTRDTLNWVPRRAPKRKAKGVVW